MLGPGDSAKRSPASRLYGPRRAANTPLTSPAAAGGTRARGTEDTQRRRECARRGRRLLCEGGACTVSTEARRRTIRPSDNGARRNSLHINIERGARGEGLCQQGRKPIRPANSGVRWRSWERWEEGEGEWLQSAQTFGPKPRNYESPPPHPLTSCCLAPSQRTQRERTAPSITAATFICFPISKLSWTGR